MSSHRSNSLGRFGNMTLITAPMDNRIKSESTYSVNNQPSAWSRNELNPSRLSIGTTNRADSVVALDPAYFQVSQRNNAYQNQLSNLSLNDHHSVYRGPTSQSERYDLDNASSIAPSDIDVARHYRNYRENSLKRPGTAITLANRGYVASPASIKQIKATLRASPSARMTGQATSSSEEMASRPPVPAPRKVRSRPGSSKRKKKIASPTNLSVKNLRKYSNPSFVPGDSSSSETSVPPPLPLHTRTVSNASRRRRSTSKRSSTEEVSDCDSVPAVSGPPLRRLLAGYPSGTETESDYPENNAGRKNTIPSSLAQFRPPRSMFPASDEDSDATTETATNECLPSHTFRPIGAGQQPPRIPPRPKRNSPPSWYHQADEQPSFSDEALNETAIRNQNLEAFV